MFEIGLLYSIREAITYIFEIPSGVIADNYGRRKELILCFLFYIASFVLFFFSSGFVMFASAMALFGFGEAFRSGTHKAMIYTYLERKGWFDSKNFVYGRTRSFSLLGSAVSSVVSIIIAISTGELRWLFLFCILPYLLDFALIISYPKYFDAVQRRKFSVADFAHLGAAHLISIWRNKIALKTIVSSSLFDSIFKSTKDYIQPILQTAIAAFSFIQISGSSEEDSLKITLGLVYGLIYLISSSASRNSYRIKRFGTSGKMMNRIFDIYAAVSIGIALFVKLSWIVPIVLFYISIFLLQNVRRPIFVDVIGDFMQKTERATVLSVESQLKSFWTILLAPLFGFIADTFSIPMLFLFIGIFMLAANRIVRVPERRIV